jgi:hypothetical protein
VNLRRVSGRCVAVLNDKDREFRDEPSGAPSDKVKGLDPIYHTAQA